MRFFGILLAFCSLGALLLAGPSHDVWRPIQPVPRECASMQFQAVLVDVSQSMKHGGEFEQAQKNIEDYLIRSAPACALVVLGSFGVTADVRDAQFLVTEGDRSRLVAAVRRLHPIDTSTNLDEAAKLVELLSYQLRAAYGAPANRLVVRVYSDFESSPSSGKPNFSLGEYLARRMDARYLRVSGGGLPIEQTVQLQTGKSGEENRKDPATESKRVSKASFGAAVAGGCILLCGLVVVMWFRSRSPKSPMPVGGLRALLVTEIDVAAEDGVLPAVGDERRVEVATGVPAVFSTDANSATYIAATVPDAANGELFRVEPLIDGSVRIQSPHSRLTVNDEPLDVDRRLKVDIHEPIRVCLHPREFNIVGVFGRPRATERGYAVFDAEPLQH